MASRMARRVSVSHVVLALGLFLSWVATVAAFECIQRCAFDSTGSIVAQRREDEHCLIAMPDNPHKEGNRTFPCELEIHTNCTEFCHLRLSFEKFHLPPCSLNFSSQHDVCNQVHSCEYVVLRERGQDEDGVQLEEITWFDGHLTDEIYESRTDKVLLQFCYRSETFSARNIQLIYKAIDPALENRFDPGPWSVYVLSIMVVIFVIAIFVVRYSSLLNPCLDPPPQKGAPMVNL